MTASVTFGAGALWIVASTILVFGAFLAWQAIHGTDDPPADEPRFDVAALDEVGKVADTVWRREPRHYPPVNGTQKW